MQTPIQPVVTPQIRPQVALAVAAPKAPTTAPVAVTIPKFAPVVVGARPVIPVVPGPKVNTPVVVTPKLGPVVVTPKLVPVIPAPSPKTLAAVSPKVIPVVAVRPVVPQAPTGTPVIKPVSPRLAVIAPGNTIAAVSPKVTPVVVAIPKVAIPAPRVAVPPVTTMVIARPPVVVAKTPVLTMKVQAPVVMPRMQPIPTPYVQPAVVEPVAVQLQPWQLEWAPRAAQILTENHGYVDTSEQGAGKTHIVFWLAQQFGFRLLVICPVTTMDMWRDLGVGYGVNMVDVINYESLRSMKNKQPKHGLLDRHDVVSEGGMSFTSFTPTRSYEALVEQGILVICDECQNIKNNSAQYKACSALLRPIINGGGRSRFGLLSGTHFDKPEMAANLMRLIGYIRAPKLYSVRNREIIPEGIQELIDIAHVIDRGATDAVLAEIPMIKSRMNDLCYALYTRVIKMRIVGAMPAPTNIEGEFDVKNGFYNINAQRTEELRGAIAALAHAVQYVEGQQTATLGADNIGAVTKALVRIEVAKTDDMARVAAFSLRANPNCKVILCMNYKETINGLAQHLAEYRPLILTGDTKKHQRTPIINAFNGDLTYRVLIMNTRVGGVGISLHDVDGGKPRVMIMSPSYKVIDIAQAAARIYRAGTKSDAHVRMFYGKNTGNESNILSAMAKKTATLKGTLAEGVRRGMPLPGDYPSEMEP